MQIEKCRLDLKFCGIWFLFQVHGTYEREIYRSMHERETRMDNVWGYLVAKQKDIGVSHRKILINWLVDVSTCHTGCLYQEAGSCCC